MRDGRPLAGEFTVELNEFLLICGNILFGIDRGFRTFRNAHGAVDAFVGIDHQKVGTFPEAVNRADINAVGAFAADAGFTDNVGHGAELLLNSETEKERNRLFYQRRAPLNSHGRPRLFGCCLGLQGILRAEKPCVLQAYAQSDGGNRRSLKIEKQPEGRLVFSLVKQGSDRAPRHAGLPRDRGKALQDRPQMRPHCRHFCAGCCRCG